MDDGATSGRWSRARRALAEAPAAATLIAIQVAVLALVEARLGPATDVDVLVRAGALERSMVRDGHQWWRLLTAAFLHVGWAHLAWNAVAGWGWSWPVEKAIGSRRFLACWLVAAVSGSACSLLGHDVVSAGASGALFGMAGATLVLHRRALPSWAAFLRSPLTLWIAGMTAAWVLLAGQFVAMDHLAHLGGLLGGAAAAWIATGPVAGRAARWAPLLAALAALVVVAAWPRPGLSAYEERALVRSIHEALRRDDQSAAAAGLARVRAAGVDTPWADYLEGLLLTKQGRLEPAAALLGNAARSADGPLRADARRAFGEVARVLGYRAYTGDGAPKDPVEGLHWFERSCEAGNAPACDTAARIRGDPVGPGAP